MYLAVQIRHNTRAVRTASRQHVVDTYRTINRLLLDPSVARPFVKGLSDFPDLPFEERSTSFAMMNEHALFFQGAFALHEAGQLEPETYDAYLDWVATVLAAPGSAAWWALARPVYANRVVAAIDERLNRGGLPEVREFPAYRLDDEPAVQQGAAVDDQQRVLIEFR